MLKFTFSFLATLCVASLATAGVMVQTVQNADPAPGLESYTVKLIGTDGASVSTVRQFVLTNVHQVFENVLGNGDTPRFGDAAGTFGNAAWTPLDTHLLALPPFNNSPGWLPVETNNGTNPAGISLAPSNPAFAAFPGSAGIGELRFTDSTNPSNNLEATLAFLAPQPSTVDFLQVIVQAGQQANLKMFVEDSNVAGTSFDLLIGGDVPPILPVAVGSPVSGSSISLQGAFDNRSGQLLQAIMVTNGNPGSNPVLEFDASDLVFTSNDEGLFSAAINGTDPSKIDLFIDVDAASTGIGRNVGATLEVRTNGGTLIYNLSARVPEPSTVALAGLAMVGLVGFARRRK